MSSDPSKRVRGRWALIFGMLASQGCAVPARAPADITTSPAAAPEERAVAAPADIAPLTASIALATPPVPAAGAVDVQRTAAPARDECLAQGGAIFRFDLGGRRARETSVREALQPSCPGSRLTTMGDEPSGGHPPVMHGFTSLIRLDW